MTSIDNVPGGQWDGECPVRKTDFNNNLKLEKKSLKALISKNEKEIRYPNNDIAQMTKKSPDRVQNWL